jgi:hypothetical protein
MIARVLAVLAVLLALGAVPTSAYQTAPNGSGDPRYRSVIRTIQPATSGLSARVLGHDNLVALDNRSNRDVIVYGYSGDQYARLLADGTVQLNLRSPAFYLNEYRFGDQRVPSYADAGAPPQWRTEDHSGQLLWHDHRIHVAKAGAPPPGTRRDTLLHGYRIPLQVGAQPGAISGQLYWVGGTGNSSGWQLFALPPAALLLLLLVSDTVRRSRRRQRQSA